MAQRVQIILEDDIDGSLAAETLNFGLDGVNYEIDLSEANAAMLRADLELWVSKARRVGGRRNVVKKSAGKSNTAAIREWAEAQGIELNARGRIPFDIRERYEASLA